MMQTRATPQRWTTRTWRQQRQDRLSERIRHEAHQERVERLLASGLIPAGIWDDVAALREQLWRAVGAIAALGRAEREDPQRTRLGGLVEVLERRIGELRDHPGVAVAVVPVVEVQIRRPVRRGGA